MYVHGIQTGQPGREDGWLSIYGFDILKPWVRTRDQINLCLHSSKVFILCCNIPLKIAIDIVFIFLCNIFKTFHTMVCSPSFIHIKTNTTTMTEHTCYENKNKKKINIFWWMLSYNYGIHQQLDCPSGPPRHSQYKVKQGRLTHVFRNVNIHPLKSTLRMSSQFHRFWKS